MRFIIAALAFMLAACGPSQAPPAGAPESTAGSPVIEPQTFTLESEAVVGQWSFDRSCGLYDLVFYADANVDYFDYSDPNTVVSYGGQWTEEPDNQRVTLTLYRHDAEGHISGDPIEYVLDLITPPTDDLNGRFGRADGSFGLDVHARRCPEEDRQ